jgi:hypothetical protein
VLVAAALTALTHAGPGRAADEAVQISCPDLTPEQTAEIESRIRASLLTTEVTAAVTVVCRSDSADVRVDRPPESVVVNAPTSVAGFRDDVLRAVEQALEELRRRQAAAVPGAPSTDVARAEPEPPAPASSAPPPAAIAPRPDPPVAPRPLVAAPPPPARAWTELSGAFTAEAWDDRAALGGALGVARSTPTLYYGLQAAVLRPASHASGFTVLEAHASAQLGVQPRFAGGIRLTLGVGPSVLFVEPQGNLTALTSTAKASLFVAAHLSRAFWLGDWALVPDLGVRLFTGERGVSVDGQQQLVLGGFALQASAGIAYRVE